MLSRTAKEEQVKEFNKAFKASPSVMVVEYKGLSVGEMEKLRKEVSDAQAELKVVKNTLLKIAAKNTDVEQIDELFEGPTAVAICESDPSALAKVFVNIIKDAPMLKIKGGIVDGSVVGANEISELSKLPSRPELISQFMGLLAAPLSNLLGAFTQMQTKLLYALEAVKDTKEATAEPEQTAKEPEKTAEQAEAATQEAVDAVEDAKEAVEETAEASGEAPEEAPEKAQAAEEAVEQSEEAAPEAAQEAAEDTEEAVKEPEKTAEEKEEAAAEPEKASEETQQAAEETQETEEETEDNK
jgi:large subunit ribosomal protein L10